jgi:hypothetical protein
MQPHFENHICENPRARKKFSLVSPWYNSWVLREFFVILQEVSFQTTKLLTKAYYQLLKEKRTIVTSEAVEAVRPSGGTRLEAERPAGGNRQEAMRSASCGQGSRLSWDILKQTDIPQVNKN